MNQLTPEFIEIEMLNLMQQSRTLNNMLRYHKDKPSFVEIEHVISMVSEPIINQFNKIVGETTFNRDAYNTFMQVTLFVEGYEEIRRLAQYVSSEVTISESLDSLDIALAAAKMLSVFGDNDDCSRQHLFNGLKALKNGKLNPNDTSNFDDYPFTGIDRDTQSSVCMGEIRENVFQYQYFMMMEKNGSPYNAPYFQYGSPELISSARTIYRDSNHRIAKQAWLIIKEAHESITCECCHIIPSLLESVGLDYDLLN